MTITRTNPHRPPHRTLTQKLLTVALVAGLATAASACGKNDNPSGGATQPSAETKTVRLVTHGSFAISDELKEQFKQDTGFTLEALPSQDAGAMVNQLILTKDAPLGDAVFGIDNTFASRAIDEGLLEPYTSAEAGPEQDLYATNVKEQLTAVDFSDVCVNVDTRVIADGAKLTFDDLLKPEFKDQLVVENPATSSPGLAFLLATISAKGEDGWLDYWKALQANGVKIVSGWDEAYYTEFSGPSSEGKRPLVVSYASSPPSEIPEGASEPVTTAALNTCFRQVEYAGVLKGAANPEGAQKAVDFLLSKAFQAELPTQMWVYPVKGDAPLPEDWAQFAPLAEKPWELPASQITKGRDSWLEQFNNELLG
ncbi:MAG: thiamine ABC transporter substrate-binding protein [Bifidobacteriaceae bacterium]|nr:thiamine ABC transporter substrate-binding protein [Bifidobacteriaceae bacterium]